MVLISLLLFPPITIALLEDPVGTLTLLSRRPLPGHAVKYSERRAGDRTRRQGRDYAGM